MSSNNAAIINIKKLCEMKEISQNELGRRMGLTESGISRLMNGNRRWTLDKLDKVAKVLSVDPHILLKK